MHKQSVCVQSGTVWREDEIRKAGQETLSQGASLEASVLDQAVSTLTAPPAEASERKQERGERLREGDSKSCVFVCLLLSISECAWQTHRERLNAAVGLGLGG